MLLAPLFLLIISFRTDLAFTVTGKVTDAGGNPVSGASVREKGTRTGTTTDKNGVFRITVKDGNSILQFSAAGFETTEVSLNGKTSLNVAMNLAPTLGTEVIVTGLGYKREEDGYSALVPGSTFNPAPVRRDLSGTLNGKVSGVSVVSNGQGYVQQSIRLRGTRSMNMNDQFRQQAYYNDESYDKITENGFQEVSANPLSTFSIDVDAASYSNVRRFLNQGQLPPANAVRIEEMINYFHYNYPQPEGDQPFSINTEITDAPWSKDHKLVLIGLQGKQIPMDKLPPSNIVFLVDVSGSMDEPNKLPLVKASMKMLVDQLREQDKISMVVYAGAAGLVLPPTSGSEKIRIKDAIDRLNAGGSTAGGAGIQLAYKTAKENFKKEGNNRVILCTDGDFNVGASSDADMEQLIENERKSGVFLTVLGFGMGNYKDSKMQKLADKGNGNHAYIDGITEAKKVLVNEFGGTLFTIAKDVKLQIEFNPAKVQAYRLIGYENRMLAKEDFNDDKKDAGELGSGHTVTALYEVIPVGVKSGFLPQVDPLKYQQQPVQLSTSAQTDEILTVKFRYKAPDADVSKLIVQPVLDKGIAISKSSQNLQFAAAVAEFGMLLRNSEFRQNAKYTDVITMARRARGEDRDGYRSEFIRLAESAELLAKGETPEKEDDGEK